MKVQKIGVLNGRTSRHGFMEAGGQRKYHKQINQSQDGALIVAVRMLSNGDSGNILAVHDKNAEKNMRNCENEMPDTAKGGEKKS